MGNKETLESKKTKHRGANIILTILQILIVIVAITISAILIANPDVQKTKAVGDFPVKLLPVLTDSMKGDKKDSFNAGDLLVSVTPKDTSKLTVNTIVTFLGNVNGETALITHRIVEVMDQLGDGTVVYKTQGDSSTSESETIKETDILAIYAFHIPKIGEYIFNLQQRPDIFLLVVVLPLAVLFIWNIILFVKMISDLKAKKATEIAVLNATESLLQIDEEEIKKKAIAEYLASLNEGVDTSAEPKTDATDVENKNANGGAYEYYENMAIAVSYESPMQDILENYDEVLTNDNIENNNDVINKQSAETNEIVKSEGEHSTQEVAPENTSVMISLSESYDPENSDGQLVIGDIHLYRTSDIKNPNDDLKPFEDTDDILASESIIENFEGMISGGSDESSDEMDGEIKVDLLYDNPILSGGIISLDEMLSDDKEKLGENVTTENQGSDSESNQGEAVVIDSEKDAVTPAKEKPATKTTTKKPVVIVPAVKKPLPKTTATTSTTKKTKTQVVTIKTVKAKPAPKKTAAKAKAASPTTKSKTSSTPKKTK
ncbi:MAG: hypothetical protein LBF68_02225 [Christensenellaceae bacterium]|jgi:signal peptidase|nr:hypothetical protein [Christensenellaceae bacterium]